jgi:hypothetical protein
VEQAIVNGINTSQVITGVVFVVALVVFLMRRMGSPKSSPALSDMADEAE